MGKKTKGSKKFINKAESQHYFLLHRSQRDGANAGEERPSDFVLVPASQNGNESRKGQRSIHSYFGGEGADTEGSAGPVVRDHITSLGFKNDGYDYSQHLKPMGGGRFIGRDGKAQSHPLSAVLPADALPSDQPELERDLQAITISSEFMDEDIRAALFEEAEEFEELDDDFVSQAMEPASGEAGQVFDFDAHIAKLIEQSERALHMESQQGPRGWTGTKGGKFIRNKRHEDVDEFQEMEDWDEEFDDDEGDESDEDGGHRGKAAGGEVVDEELFDKLAEEYDDDQIGDLEEDEEAIEGLIELDEGDELFNSALDEYLEEKKADSAYTMDKSYKIATAKEKSSIDCPESDVVVTPDLIKLNAREEMISQLVNAIEVPKPAPGKKNSLLDLIDVGVSEADEGLLTCQAYLREERVEEEWDCETVLSTYSTLDNHPKLIKDPKSKFRVHKSRYTLHSEEQEQLSAVRSTLPGYVTASGNPVPATGPVNKIVLQGKLSLPEEYVKMRRAARLAKVDEEGDDEDDGQQEEKENSEEENGDAVADKRPVGEARKKGESAEEKKARKQAVKEERRQKRLTKKAVKASFSQEKDRTSASTGELTGVSVFRFSS